MGLFSKPKEDKVIDLFNDLTPELQETVRKTLFGGAEQKPAEEVVKATEPSGEVVKTEDVIAEGVVDGVEQKTEGVVKVEEQPNDEHKETYEDVLDRLKADYDKKFEELRKELDNKLEPLVSVASQKKPFGLSEAPKEYKATYRTQETSDEMLKKMFGK